jgi:hypothetical protein
MAFDLCFKFFHPIAKKKFFEPIKSNEIELDIVKKPEPYKKPLYPAINTVNE